MMMMMQLDDVCSLRDGIEIVPHFYYIQEEEACSPPSYVLRSRIDMDGLNFKGCCMCNSLWTVLTCNLILL
jgi:hypothetical protein